MSACDNNNGVSSDPLTNARADVGVNSESEGHLTLGYITMATDAVTLPCSQVRDQQV